MSASISYRAWPLALCCLMMLVACIPAPRTANLAPPGFHDKPELVFDVADIRLRNEYQPTGSNHVEMEMPTSPAEGVGIWKRDRLRAMGQEGVLEVVIKDAGATKTALPVKQGLSGALTKEPASRYDGVLEVELRLYKDGHAISTGRVEARVEMTREIMEKASRSEEMEFEADMVREMLRRLDAQLERGIRQYFSVHMIAD